MRGTYSNGFAPRDGMARYPGLWRGCIGAWNPGLGQTGQYLRDWSGRKNTGLISNPTWSPTSKGYFLNFSTGFYYLDLTNILSYPASNTISMSFWMNATSWSGSNPGIWRSGATYSGNDFFILQGTTGRPWIRRNGVDVLKPASGYGISLNQLTHVCITANNTIANFYADGDLKHTATHSTTGIAFDIYRIPTQSSNERPVGDYADFMFYDRLLNANEVKLLSEYPGIAYELAPRKRVSPQEVAATTQQVFMGFGSLPSYCEVG